MFSCGSIPHPSPRSRVYFPMAMEVMIFGFVVVVIAVLIFFVIAMKFVQDAQSGLQF